MNDARAIAVQLVDIRNVGTHKVLKLTIHVPEEQAMQVVELFGWPTGVNPVPVALARLQNGKEVDATESKYNTTDTPPAQPSHQPTGRAHHMANESGSSNKFGVGVYRDHIVISDPPRGPITKADALNLAAWLKVLADD